MYFILLEGKFYWNSTPMFGVLLININNRCRIQLASVAHSMENMIMGNCQYLSFEKWVLMKEI
ncbi:hypothetical protein [uncultured Gammaproteobacteria bacterium]|nr:hypothetical protein [uncultured Gammaproteobacteria bacterium]